MRSLPSGAASVALTSRLVNTWESCWESIAQVADGCARTIEEDGPALEQAALALDHLVPHRIRVARREGDRTWASVLEQRGHHAVEPLDLAQDAADVLLDDRILSHAESEELCGGRDAEERIAQLVRDAGRHLADCLESALVSETLYDPRAFHGRRRFGGDGLEHATRFVDAVRGNGRAGQRDRAEHSFAARSSAR